MRSLEIRRMSGGGATREGVREEVSMAKPDSHVVLFRGRDGDVRFPPVCPNCELPAASVIPVIRHFVFLIAGDGDTPNRSEPAVDTLRVPFCSSCAALLRGEQIPAGALDPEGLAVDFTPCLSLKFEPEWRAFQFRSAHYCDLFRQANAEHLWNPEGAEATAAKTKRQNRSFRTTVLFLVIAAVLALWVFWRDNFQ